MVLLSLWNAALTANPSLEELPTAGPNKRQYQYLESDTESETFELHPTEVHHRVTLGSVMVSSCDDALLKIVAPGDREGPTAVRFAAKSLEISEGGGGVKKRKISHDRLEAWGSLFQHFTPVRPPSPTLVAGPEQQSMSERMVGHCNKKGIRYNSTTPWTVKKKSPESADCRYEAKTSTSHVTPKKECNYTPGIIHPAKGANLQPFPQQQKNHDIPSSVKIQRMMVRAEKSKTSLAAARKAAVDLELELMHDPHVYHAIKTPAAPPVRSGVEKGYLRGCLRHERSSMPREMGKTGRRVELDSIATLHRYVVRDDDRTPV
ncbi:hypothetical protein EV426DRAFT_577167 [Tirmania nivea]|nr:hypothetical protein EV426DRAFT_577167 [Tirmania nivea]